MLSRTLLILLPLSTPGLRYHQIISAFPLILCLYLAQLRPPPFSNHQETQPRGNLGGEKVGGG